MKHERAALLLVACALAVSSVSQASTLLPRYVDTQLGGAFLLKSPYFKAYDPRTGYRLWVEHEFDGASNTIFIAQDPRLFGRPKSQVKDYRIIPFTLGTGRGIRIGSRVSQLHRDLGAPSTFRNLKIMGERCHISVYYHDNQKLGSQKRRYEAVYVSRQGRIRGIRFSYYRGTW